MRTWGRGILIAGWMALAGLLLWRILGLYEGPWEEFAGRTHQFLSAATIGDSTYLTSFGASPEAIHRVLETARTHPEQVTGIGRLEVREGRKVGDTVRIAFAYPGCASNLLLVTFRGAGYKARIEEVSLPCEGR